MNTYKLILCGASKVGKTSFVKKLTKNEFNETYIPTIGVDVRPFNFDSNTVFNIWDLAGYPIYKGLSEGYFCAAHCAIIMFSHYDILSKKMIHTYREDIKRICGDIPIVVIANQFEQIPQDIRHKDYISISVEAGFKLRDPFIKLIDLLSPKNIESLTSKNELKDNTIYINNILEINNNICKILDDRIILVSNLPIPNNIKEIEILHNMIYEKFNNDTKLIKMLHFVITSENIKCSAFIIEYYDSKNINKIIELNNNKQFDLQHAMKVEKYII